LCSAMLTMNKPAHPARVVGARAGALATRQSRDYSQRLRHALPNEYFSSDQAKDVARGERYRDHAARRDFHHSARMAAFARIVMGANGDELADCARAATGRAFAIAGAGHHRDRANSAAGADVGYSHTDAFVARVQLQLLRARHRYELDGPGERGGLLCRAAGGGGRVPQLQRTSRATIAVAGFRIFQHGRGRHLGADPAGCRGRGWCIGGRATVTWSDQFLERATAAKLF
jgi:hypothetical protein